MNSIEKLRKTSLPGGREISHLPARGSGLSNCLKDMVSNLLSKCANTPIHRDRERGEGKGEREVERKKERDRRLLGKSCVSLR